MRKALLIAFHFPPFQGSSGLQRTLSFCRGLPAHNWLPTVLTVRRSAYPQTDDSQLTDIPSSVSVERAFALDAARHLSVCGRYLKSTALPDRWISWLPGAVISGLRSIRRDRPLVLWSTYPIATAHVVGAVLHRLTGLPWIADFRDPMVETVARTGETFPKDLRERRARLWVEQQAAQRATCNVFCTDGARRIFTSRYAEVSADRTRIIENGFDEGIFAEVERHRGGISRSVDGPLVLLHSGVLYNSTDRSPAGLFDALRLLLQGGRLHPNELTILLRASGHEDIYGRMIAERGLDAVVTLAPAVPYRDALAEMLEVDGLLLFQGFTSNPAIPAKAYEYLRAQRPVFALTDAEGETAKLVSNTGVGRVAPLDDPPLIAEAMLEFLHDVRRAAFRPLEGAALRHFSRETRAAELAELFDEVAGARGAARRPMASVDSIR